MHLRARPRLLDMRSRGVDRKPPRIRKQQQQPPLPSSSSSRLQNRLQLVRTPKQQPTAADLVRNAETTKAVAWAVFQHNGGGDGRANPGHLHCYNLRGVRRPTRFMIEAQMKQEITHRSSMKEVVAIRWDAGSTLFDSFELDSLLKTLDDATHPGEQRKEAEAGAVVVYSPKHEIPKTRIVDEDGAGAVKPAVKPPKDASHSNLWRSLIHSLHLDGALFHGLQKLQSQVVPHDSKSHKGRRSPKSPGGSKSRRPPSITHIDVAQFDALFGGYDFPVSKDGRHLWNLSLKASFKMDQEFLDPAWEEAAAFAATTTTRTTNVDETDVLGVSHHHHHHHHHQHHQYHRDVREDIELTVQAISRRVARASFEEKVRRVSMEFESGMEAPRNSLDVDYVERMAMISKPRSVWDSY